MLFKRLFWNLLLPVIALLGAIIFFLSWYFVREVRQLYLSQTEQHLQQIAAVWRPRAENLMALGRHDELMEGCRELKRITGNRVTLISPDGVVLADTDEDPEAMDNHRTRPEIQAASTHGEGVSVRFSHTVRQWMMYYALKLTQDHGLGGFLRIARPVAAMEKTLATLRTNTIYVGVGIFLLATVVAALLSHQITSPLHRMTETAEALAQGDFDRRVPYSTVEEVRRLSDAFNRMVVRLQLAMRNSDRQAAQLSAVLDSMAEGVIAIDHGQHIASMNSAARSLLEISPSAERGHLLAEVVRQPEILDAAQETVEKGRPVRTETALRRADGTEVRIEVRANPLFDEHQRPSGAVLVIHDINRLWQLERIRRDFVANVSHELKTPITSIKGSVETLLDGAMDDPEARGRFLEIIRRHADRLNAIITDLLTLSRMEQEGELRQITRQPTPIRGLLEEAAQVVRHRAEEKHIELDVDCPAELTASVAPDLLEQAVINLLDNAIKYSDTGKTVWLSGRAMNGRLQIQVADQGCGIPQEHLPRIFERFYRVDKARSRALGGTGLGLAIVKHIMNLHQGNVSVESTVGKGSVFTLDIPLGI